MFGSYHLISLAGIVVIYSLYSCMRLIMLLGSARDVLIAPASALCG